MSYERVRITHTGWDHDLAFETVEGGPPTPARGHVTVAVEACGVCYRDLIDREGRFPFIQLPVTPGHEAVGRVVAVGADVSEWAVGDRVGTMHRDACGACEACRRGDTSLCEGAAWVFGLMADGGYASYVSAPERAFFGVPDDIPAAQAAVLHCTFGTAYRSMVTVGGLRAGEDVVITGANGGVGASAVPLAKRLGARVVAVVRDARHVPFVESLGADAVVVDDGTGFHKKLPFGRVDLVLENVGEPTFNSSLRCLRLGGRLSIVGNVVAARATLNLGYLVVNGLRVLGSGGATRSDMEALFALWRDAPFHVPVEAELPLCDADRAQRMVRAGGRQGRLVLVPGRP
jgi:acryloyl-coenzyme A reductase